MDDSALFCLTRRPPPSPTLDVPGRALACRALLAFNYQSAGIVPDCTRSDIRVLPQCLPPLFCADTLDNDSICLTDASRRGKKNVCLILTARFMVVIIPSTLTALSSIFHSKGTAIFFQGIHNTHVVAI